MKYKGWNKLIVQIGLLSISMMLLSLITETQLWLDWFTYYVPEGDCKNATHFGYYKEHYHYNYRGVVYVITGIVYFLVSVIRIIMSHKEEDFKL